MQRDTDFCWFQEPGLEAWKHAGELLEELGLPLLMSRELLEDVGSPPPQLDVGRHSTLGVDACCRADSMQIAQHLTMLHVQLSELGGDMRKLLDEINSYIEARNALVADHRALGETRRRLVGELMWVR